MSVRGHHKRRSLTVNTDLKLMPLMNIIISLIPMLLLSAVFIEVKVIEPSLPRDAGAAPAAARRGRAGARGGLRRRRPRDRSAADRARPGLRGARLRHGARTHARAPGD